MLNRVREYLSEIADVTADRALQWVYLSETESSYAIEGERADLSKSERFVNLLQHAHDSVELTEQYLCDLQNQVISNPYDMAFSYRTEQNWLSSGGRGALGVSYVPPSPDCLDGLMRAFLDMANSLPKQIHPVIAASVTSFGFVFLHPFMDGNGRLSRFLFHQQLCSSGQFYLMCFDEIHRAVSGRYDIRETTLHHLINGCLDLNGVVSKNLRKRYANQVEATLFDYLENVTKETLSRHSK